MIRHRTLLLATTLGLALVTGIARADGPGGAYAGVEIGTIRYINRVQNLIILTDGNEFRAPDPRMLSNLREGELVKVDFMHDNDRSTINSIEPADADSSSGAVPSAEFDSNEH